MVNQGDIIKLNFNPQVGYEQAGYGPSVVVSNYTFNERTSLTLICPITKIDREFPLHIELDDKLTTTGMVNCEQIKSVDLSKWEYEYIETLPEEVLHEIVDIIIGEVEI